MKLKIIAVGNVKEAAMRSLCEDYRERIGRHAAVDVIEIADGAPDKVLAEMIRLAKGAHVVALEAAGRELDSPAFAREIDRMSQEGKGDIAFLIGGKAGLPRTVLAPPFKAWSLSRLTFPHRLARLVLLEQLYRAMAILKNEPYAASH